MSVWLEGMAIECVVHGPEGMSAWLERKISQGDVSVGRRDGKFSVLCVGPRGDVSMVGEENKY
jgi:hypothetical protein